MACELTSGRYAGQPPIHFSPAETALVMNLVELPEKPRASDADSAIGSAAAFTLLQSTSTECRRGRRFGSTTVNERLAEQLDAGGAARQRKKTPIKEKTIRASILLSFGIMLNLNFMATRSAPNSPINSRPARPPRPAELATLARSTPPPEGAGPSAAKAFDISNVCSGSFASLQPTSLDFRTSPGSGRRQSGPQSVSDKIDHSPQQTARCRLRRKHGRLR